VQLRDGTGKEAKVVQIQIMTGVYAKAGFSCDAGALHIRLYGNIAVHLKLTGKGFGIQFDAICPNLSRSFHHPRHRVYKQGNPYTKRLDFFNDFAEKVCMAYSVPSAVGGDCIRRIRYQGRSEEHTS